MSEDRKIQIETAVDTTGAHAGFEQIKRDAGSMAAAVASKGAEASRGMDGIGAGASRSAAQVEAAQRNLIGSIQRTTAAMEAGSKSGSAYYEVLARQRGVDPKVLEPYLVQLRTLEATQGRATAALASSAPSIDRIGVSAKQTAAALRGVPAQFTDIVTAIQGGQAPLTVLLQQGGQLKDMFGGTGAAARALGGYIVGLINPFTVAAVAAGVLALAYYQGSNEAKEYAKSIALSGNAAGVTAGQLGDLAKKVSASVGTQAAAAEAIAALVGTGKVSAANIEQFSAVALRGQRALGVAVGDTATAFADLAKNPVTGLEKLNEQYHFLTGSVYEQVRALKDQGKAYEAGQLAQQAFATGFDNISTKVTENLGAIDRILLSAKDGWKSFWDAALNVGRADSLEVQLEKVRAKIEKTRGMSDFSIGSYKAKAFLPQDLETEANLEKQIALERTKAAIQADQARFNAADLAWSQSKFQFMTRQQQLDTELTAERNKGLDAGRSDLEIEERLGAVRKKYADIYNDGIDSQIEKLKRRAAVEEELSKRAIGAVTAARAVGSITEDEAINRTAALQLKTFDAERALLEQELDLAKKKQNSLKEQADLQGQLAVVVQQRKSREAQLEQDLFALEVKRSRLAAENYANVVDKLAGDTKSLQDQVLAQKDYNGAIGLTKVQLAALTAARLEDQAARKDEEAGIAEGLDMSGRLADAYREQAAALRDRATAITEGAFKEQQFDDWKKAVDTYGDVFRTGFADMLNNGKSGWKSFTKSLVTTFKTSVADQIYKMFAQPFVVQVVGQLLGTTGSGLAGAVTSATGGGTSGSGVLGAFSSAASLASAGKAIYAGFAGGFSSAVGTGISSFGNLVGSQAISAFGTGASLTASQAATAASAYSTAGNTAVAGGLTSGASAGAYAIPIAGWIAAGMALSSSLYKQGWDVNNGTVNDPLKLGGGPMIFNNILKGIGLSNSAANVFSGQATIARLFGRRDPTVEESGIQGTLNASGFNGNSYQNILEKGGLFRRDKRYTTTANLDTGSEVFLDGTIKNLISSVKSFGEVLGVESHQIDGFTKDIKLSLTSDATKNQEIITKLFGDIGDDLSKLLIPTINEFSKSAEEFGGKAESASETLQRIATDYATIDGVLKATGSTFGAVGLASVGARERLLELSGGVDAFGKGAAFFAQNYLSEAERLVPVAATVTDMFSQLGLAVPETREEFKTLKLGLDLTTEAGATTYAKLTSVQEAFAQLHPAIQSAADALSEQNGLQDQLDQLTMSPSELLAKQRAAVSEANRGLFDQVQAYTAIKKAQDAARETMNSLGNAIAGAMDSAQGAAKALRSFNDSLLIGSTSPLSNNVKYDLAKQQFQNAKPEDLQSAAQAFLEASRAKGGTVSYARDFAAVSSALTSAADGKDQYVKNLINFYRSLSESGTSIGAHANGGVASGWSLVGENGPELANFVSPARVYTAQQTQDAIGGGMSAKTEALLDELITEMQKGNKEMKETAASLDGLVRGKFSIKTVAA